MDLNGSDFEESYDQDQTVKSVANYIENQNEELQDIGYNEAIKDSTNPDDKEVSEVDLTTSRCAEKSEQNIGLVISEKNQDKDYLEFIEKLFPKKRHDWILKDEDLISPEQSYFRLTWLGIVLTCILSLATLGQVIQVLVIVWLEKSPLVVQPILPEDIFLRKFPMPHLVTISETGEIYDFSFAENISPSRGYLFKLKMATDNGSDNYPKNTKLPRHYYAFSDSNGFLHFVDSELRQDIIQYHQKQGHRVKPNSAIQEQPKRLYAQSLPINGFFWLFGRKSLDGFESIYPFTGAQDVFTKMWSLKKNTIVDGPNLDSKSGNWTVAADRIPYCAATLNRSHFAMIAYLNNDDPQPLYTFYNQRFAIVNFRTQKVIGYPNLPAMQEGEFDYCSASILHSKANVRTLVVHLQLLNRPRWFIGPLQFKKFSYLMSYDLDKGVDGQWMVHGTWEVENDPRLLNFWQLKGSFYSLFSDGSFIYHQNLYDWQSLTNFSHKFSKFVGNGAIYYV